jgi:RNA polymerase sigma-70 factor, ECF subfamily
MDDLFLVKQVVNGNKNAFKFLVLRYQRPIFKFLSRFGLNPTLAEEIAQETFLRSFKNLHTYDAHQGATFSTWLFTIAKNLALNEIAKHHHHMEKTIEDPTDLYNIADENPPPSSEATYDQAQIHAQVHQAIQALPLLFRSAVILACLKEHSIEEIAQIENCSPGTVKSRIFRGKQLLKSILPKETEGT